MPDQAKAALVAALHSAGYTELEFGYPFDRPNQDNPEVASADIVAFVGAPHDQSTAAVAARWLSNRQERKPFLEGLGRSLWVPYAIVATPESCELWEIFPPRQTADELSPVSLALDLSYSDLESVFADRDRGISRGTVQTLKRKWRQTALYEADTEPNAFFRWAYLPTRERLTGILSDVLSAARKHLAPDGELDAVQFQWLVRLIGVRIAWDKRWIDPGTRTSAGDILASALRYPTDLSSRADGISEDIEALAEVVAGSLGTVHLGAADGGLLSQLLQEGSIPRTLQQAWKIYPTPQNVAWRMVSTLPFESLPDGRRIVWDGTCGSGTILVAALERLRDLVPHYSLPQLRSYLVRAVAGNDIAPALADTCRIALDLALGAPVGEGWRIGVGDVGSAASPALDPAPTIIVGNPPFQGTGRTPDQAISIIGGYLDTLQPGGLLSVVVPRSLLATAAARLLRERLLRHLAVYEVWELPKGTFEGTDQETAVLIGRKCFAAEPPNFGVTWRRLPKGGGKQDIDSVSQADWLRTAGTAMLPPLAFRLDAHFEEFTKLSVYVTKDNRTQGITPGIGGRSDILDHPEPGAVPYLSGRQHMLPFMIPWKAHPRWLRYWSPNIQWPRRRYADLFRSRKIFVSRLVTWGSAWRVRAAIDDGGIFPSDQFIVMIPDAPLSMEFVAGLFNSSLANCWLKLTNPSNIVSLHQILRLPAPGVLTSPAVRRVEDIARAMSDLRRPGEQAPVDMLGSLTLALDDAIFEAYQVPDALRREISEHFLWLGDRRDGFDDPMVRRLAGSASHDSLVLSEEEAERMRLLFEARRERSLSSREDAELNRLVDLWQRAYANGLTQHRSLSASRRHPDVPTPSPT